MLVALPNGALALGFTTPCKFPPFAKVTTTLPPLATATRGLLDAPGRLSTCSGALHAPPTSRDTHTCAVAPFRYAIAAVPSGATSL